MSSPDPLDPLLEAPITPERVERRLRWVRWIAAVDLVMLIALVTASLSGARDWVRVLGPIHGGNFIVLCVLIYLGASDRLWSWWFLAGTVFTGGPIGALVGDILITRRLKAQ